MGVIMVFGIIGLGLAAPIVYPAVFIYGMFQSLSYKVEEFFENCNDKDCFCSLYFYF